MACCCWSRPNERKVWIATGYGAGGFLTDAMSGLITRETILPHFKQNPPDYGGGIEAGADAIIKQMSLPADQAQNNVAKAEQAQRAAPAMRAPASLPVIFWMIIIGFVILSHVRPGGRRSSLSPPSRPRRADHPVGSVAEEARAEARGAAVAAPGAADPGAAAAAGASAASAAARSAAAARAAAGDSAPVRS